MYFLVKHHIPHTTNFTDLIKLQVENGDGLLKKHEDDCSGNATYLLKTSIAQFIECISYYIEERVLSSLKASPF